MALITVFILTFGALEEKKGSPGSSEDATVVSVRIRNQKKDLERICLLKLPEDEYTKQNTLIQQRLGASVVKERPPGDAADERPRIWLGIAGKDYGIRKPRKAQLVKEFDERIKRLFDVGTEEVQELSPVAFEGVEALRMEFRGQIHANVWRGICYMFRKNGIGYLIFAAGPDLGPNDNLGEATIKDLQSRDLGFEFDTPQRSGWTEVPPKVITYTHKDHPGVTLSSYEGVWRNERAEDEDERGIIFLYGEYGGEAIDNTKDATVMVLALKPAPSDEEAPKLAFEYIEGRKKDEDKDNKLVLLDQNEKFGKRTYVGNRRGYQFEAKVERGFETFRYLLIAVVNVEGSGCYVVRCECAWKSRQIWRQDFLDLLKSLKVRKSAK